MSDPLSEIPVEFLFRVTATLGDRGVVRHGPVGTRAIVNVTGGSFEGPKLKGTVQPPGGDWVYARPDGSFKLDVRLLLQTDDGASILMTYQGIGSTDGDGNNHLRTAPTFEAGDEKYAWLNNIQAIGIGSTGDDDVTYDIYALR